MSACDRVLGLPELLENILLNLTPKDILSTQRVNTIFKDAIISSSHLQRHLFFRLPTASTPTDGLNLLLVHANADLDYELQVPGTSLATFEPDLSTLQVFNVEPPRVHEILASGASCLDMYIQRASHDIEVEVYQPVEVGMYTTITLRATTLRNLLTIAVVLSDTTAAVEMFEAQKAEEKDKKIECGPGNAWEVSLGAELIGLVVKRPRVVDG